MQGAYIEKLICRNPKLSEIREEIAAGYQLLLECYQEGHKVLVAGNGGSAADSEHLVGELMKSFHKERTIPDDMRNALIRVDYELGSDLANHLEEPLRAISLVSHQVMSTAFANDVDPEGYFAQQLYGYGDEGDLFIGITTSGNSRNVRKAAVVARAMGMKVLVLTGSDGGKIKDLSDVSVCVPEKETYLIQEMHLPIYHAWCLELEEAMFTK